MSNSDIAYLNHILDEASYLIERSGNLEKDETLKRAFARSLEIIGEASKQITDEFKQRHNRIEWRSMAGMRDRLIHAYFGVDYDIVWDVVTQQIPELHKNLLTIIQSETDEG